MRGIFDTHVHYEEPPLVSTTIENFKAVFNYHNVKKVVFLSVPHLYGELDLTHNLKALYYKKVFSPNAYAFAGLEHDFNLTASDRAQSYLDQVKKYLSVGYDGIKILEGKPTLRRVFKYKLSHPVYDLMYSYLEKIGAPITMHNAEPSEFWDESKLSAYAVSQGWGCGKGDLTKEEMLKDVLDIMKKHPKLKLTLAHFGFMCDAPNFAEQFFSYPNTKFDITPGGYEYYHMADNLDYWLKFIEKYQDRIKYGTDTTNVEIENLASEDCLKNASPTFARRWFATTDELFCYDKAIKGVQLNENLLDKIFMQNAINEYGKPKDNDDGYFYRELKRLKPLAKSEKDIIDLEYMEKTY